MTVKNSSQTTRNRVDILIVGAGPAGISAAQMLADAGAKVILLDRSAAPGGKACAGGLTRDALHLLNLTPSSLPPSSVFDTLRVVAPTGRTALQSDDRAPLLVTVDRRALQAERLARLDAAGVRVCRGERFLRFDDHVAVTSCREIAFGHLIGADGSRSRVRRQLGLETGRTIRALQVRVPLATGVRAGIEIDSPSVFFDSALLGSGYGWAFPFADELRIGMGICYSARGRSTRARFSRWLDRFGLDPDAGRLEAGTIACDYAGHRFRHIFLAGDAAGLASPLTGEGIAQALLSGREVAREILDSDYRSAEITRLAATHRRTFDALDATRLKKLLNAAPRLLTSRFLKNQTLRRFVL